MDLPTLKLVLQHVSPVVGRPDCCALVSRTWNDAAAAVTSTIDLPAYADTDSLQQWLQHHGSNLSKLHMHAATGRLTALPCPNLNDLLLRGSGLQLSRSVLGAIDAASRLTSVVLEEVHLVRALPV